MKKVEKNGNVTSVDERKSSNRKIERKSGKIQTTVIFNLIIMINVNEHAFFKNI